MTNTVTHVNDAFPPTIDNGECTHLCFAAMMEPTSQSYMDLTSKFVAPSSNGNNYILIVYDYDSNGILAVPLKSHHFKAILAAYQMAHTRLCAAGLHPKLQCLDNEASCALQDFMVAKHVNYQLVSPHIHRCNAAEHAICTFKNHFIAGLCSTNKNFPIRLWGLPHTTSQIDLKSPLMLPSQPPAFCLGPIIWPL